MTVYKTRPGKGKPGGGYYTLVGLKPAREERRVRLTELSRRSGVSRNTLYYLEGCERVARAATVHKLAQALGVDPLMLLYAPEEEDEPEM